MTNDDNRNKNTLPSYIHNAGKTSVFTPVRGSITVEAALAVPFFFFAVICLVYLFEITAIQTSVRSGLQYAGRMVMQESYPLAVLSPGSIEEKVVNAIGANRLERSIVIGGSSGIDCSNSAMSFRTGIGNLEAQYRIKIPVPFFHMQGISRRESIRIKLWTGYEKELIRMEEEQTVYITDTGLVYHKDYHCTYLDLSIRMVNIKDIDGLRNEGGGKYYECRICSSAGKSQVYITDSGDKYHGTLGCSGLKRTVYAVPLSEVTGKGACVRCGK